MDASLAALLGAFIGAAAAIVSGIMLESYKHHSSRQGTASALAGEIFAILHMTEKRQHIKSFHAMLPLLDQGQEVKIPDIMGGSPQIDPVIEKYMEKVGLMPRDLPERIAVFYSYLRGIRIDLMRMIRGDFTGNPKGMAELIREDLALWDETEKLGNGLCNDLRVVAAQYWVHFNWLLSTIKHHD